MWEMQLPQLHLYQQIISSTSIVTEELRLHQHKNKQEYIRYRLFYWKLANVSILSIRLIISLGVQYSFMETVLQNQNIYIYKSLLLSFTITFSWFCCCSCLTLKDGIFIKRAKSVQHELSSKIITTVVKEVNSISDCSAGFLNHSVIVMCKPTSNKTPYYSFLGVNLSKIHQTICKCIAPSAQDLLYVHYLGVIQVLPMIWGDMGLKSNWNSGTVSDFFSARPLFGDKSSYLSPVTPGK